MKSIINSKTFLDAPTITIIGNCGVISDHDQKMSELAECIVRFNNYGTRSGLDRTEDNLRCDTLFTTFDAHTL